VTLTLQLVSAADGLGSHLEYDADCRVRASCSCVWHNHSVHDTARGDEIGLLRLEFSPSNRALGSSCDGVSCSKGTGENVAYSTLKL